MSSKNKCIDDNAPIVYNVKDVQAIMNCGRRQAYELMNSKCFPSFRIGAKHYVYKEKFVEWLMKNTGKKITL